MFYRTIQHFLIMTNIEFNTRYFEIETLLFGFAMRLTRNKDNAKDLMQETVMRAFKSKDNYKLNTNFKAWMTTIMRNNFINSYRKKKTRSRVLAPVKDFIMMAENKTAKDSTDSTIFMKELRHLISCLSDKHRIPFEMSHQGFQYHEIAEKLGVAIGTVKSRIFFARKKLRQMIKVHYGDSLRHIS